MHMGLSNVTISNMERHVEHSTYLITLEPSVMPCLQHNEV